LTTPDKKDCEGKRPAQRKKKIYRSEEIEKDKWRKKSSWVYLEKEAGKRKRSDGNEGRPEEWHCHGGSKVAKRNDALCEGRLEMRMVTVSVSQVNELWKCLEMSTSYLTSEFYIASNAKAKKSLIVLFNHNNNS